MMQLGIIEWMYVPTDFSIIFPIYPRTPFDQFKGHFVSCCVVENINKGIIYQENT